MAEQNHALQMQGLWRRLERWAAIHAPRMLEGLDGPATEAELLALERALDRRLPLALRTSLQRHNGEDDAGVSILAHYGDLLPAHIILRNWQWGIQYETEHGPFGLEDPHAWAASIVDGHWTVQGPVKPLSHSRYWIPIASMDGKMNLYLDFDPPAGGTPGQVIRTAREFGQWQVLASSFLAFFHQYVHDLAVGRYRVDADGWIEPYEDNWPQWSGQLPAYLQSVVFDRPAPHQPSYHRWSRYSQARRSSWRGPWNTCKAMALRPSSSWRLPGDASTVSLPLRNVPWDFCRSASGSKPG